ncbi:uncharacterized protein N7506_008204 [Penicillium brevicompactum]|uniref:uncharacterized protein n=1 Tax=Penicillium brevicompactum TaxID=5074 RepID=UPI00254139BD|nr:uncharacterized protein N7506_008204 [Penicillium brevicompactum]KAJ5334421.1 hypothetical protein N7506_008204 [Penicillium brevicompactum]
MKGLIYIAVVASVQASHFGHQSLHRRATGSHNCKTHTVQDGDSCVSIGRSSVATWAQLLSWNSDINSECSNLDDLSGKDICVSNPSGDYAIPATSSSASSGATGSQSIITTTAPVPSPIVSGTNKKCAKYYQIRKDETCDTVTEKTGISKSAFMFLNPELTETYTNLQKDVYYCVQAVGDITTYLGHAGISMTSVPSSACRPDFAGALKNNSIPAIPLAKDTRKDCYDYIWINNITDNALADCWTMAMTIDVPKEDFIMWNPSLEKNATGYNYPCTLQSSSSYCVQLFKPTNTQTTRVQSPSSVAASSTQGPKFTTHA